MWKSGHHDAQFYREMWATLLRGETWRGHFINKRKDGTLFEEDATISPVRDATGRIVGAAKIAHDIAKRCAEKPGNGTLDTLSLTGSFRTPSLDDIERSFALALTHAGGRGRVLLDLWDLARFAHCERCFAPRRGRLHTMNLEQQVLPEIPCGAADRAIRR